MIVDLDQGTHASDRRVHYKPVGTHQLSWCQDVNEARRTGWPKLPRTTTDVTRVTCRDCAAELWRCLKQKWDRWGMDPPS